MNVPLQVLRDNGAQEPEWLHCSPQCCSWWWVGGEQGGSSWSPLSSPQFWVCWAPSCCDCTRQPAAQTPVCKQSRLRPWWGQWLRITHKFQELDRGVFRCAVICVEGEKQWGENTSLRGASADGESPGCEFAQPHYCYLYVRNVTVTDSMSLTEGGGHRELWERRSGTMVWKAELKSTNKIPYIIRQNIFYTVMNAMSISTALFIYFIYYLKMTWKTQLNHILSQSYCMFNVFMFPNVSVFLYQQLLHAFVHIRNFLVHSFNFLCQSSLRLQVWMKYTLHVLSV